MRPVGVRWLSLAILHGLTHLDLSNNQLTVVPAWLVELRNLETISLNGNPTVSPPPEIATEGTKSILAFLQARDRGVSRQWVSKLLVVGEGGVGKTSLIKALVGETHDSDEPTAHGLRVRDVTLPHPAHTDVTMRSRAWDFGGQQIYHATHQFYLTNRSLFLLLWNARLGWEQGKLRYWLDIIRAQAPESPVILVATHAHSSERPVGLPLDELC